MGDKIRMRYVAKYMPEGSGLALDVGAGQGLYKQLVERKGYSWVGIDPEPANDSIIKARAEALPFEDNHFDLVLCVDVLEHIADDQKAVQEMYRVLKPGKTCIVHTPNSEQTHILFEPTEPEAHVRKGYTKAELERLFSKFSSVKIIPTFNEIECLAWELWHCIARNKPININKLAANYFSEFRVKNN